MKEKFSLKDHLFNPEKVQYLASLLHSAHPAFDVDSFTREILVEFPVLELKQRITRITKSLHSHLPQDFQQAATIIINSLPEESDPTKTDDDFGDFIFAPYGEFIAHYGCTTEHLSFSLDALKEITKRFSAEDAIRYFLNAFPEQTLDTLSRWSKDTNYHVRRLASEGTRPRLPWCQKVTLSHQEVIVKILNNLYCDATRYVVRSVANHMNDISKENPELVLTTLATWRNAQKQSVKEINYLIKHALRTLIKQGHTPTMEFLGYHPNPALKITDFSPKTTTISLGQPLEFSFDLTAHKPEPLIIDYKIEFASSKDSKTKSRRQKVFKLKVTDLGKNQTKSFQKRHPLKPNMSTFKIFPGIHTVTLQINGKNFASFDFVIEG